ncbi:hypothetical protein E3J99_24325 [Salmonella enterica]|nr:hypothetical protein [Salmonella enterica]EAR8698657.1 hypothetical protein [Salmonella enterica]
MSISRRLRLVNERVSAVGAAIFGVRPFAAEGRSPWGDGRPALAGREGSRRGGPPISANLRVEPSEECDASVPR